MVLVVVVGDVNLHKVVKDVLKFEDPVNIEVGECMVVHLGFHFDD